MKKSLLLIAALIIAAGAMAQDIFVAGHKTNSSNKKEAYLYKNNTPLINTWTSTSLDLEITDIELTPAGDYLYYTKHSSQGWTDIYKISTNGGSEIQVYNCPSSSGIVLTALAYDPQGNHIYGVGYKQASSGDTRKYAVIVKDNTVMYEQDADGYESAMYGAIVVNGDVYTCGAEAWSEGGGLDNWAYLCVYKNGNRIADLHANYIYNCAYDITYYENRLYICGKEEHDGSANKSDDGKAQNDVPWRGVVWKCNLDGTGLTELFSTEDCNDTYTSFKSISTDAGSVYAYGILPGVAMPIYRYNVETGNTSKIVSNTTGSFAKQIAVNNHNYYWVSNNQYVKRGASGEVALADLPFYANALAVNCNNTQPIVHELPFYDDFNMGSTYWDEWFKYDYNDNNGVYASYWDRYDYNQGLTTARHRWNASSTGEQSADLASPAIRIPSDKKATLSFFLRLEASEDYNANNGCSVWIIEADQPDFTLTYENYTEQQQHLVWSIDDHTDLLVDNSWENVEVDLSAYKGKTIYIVFYYRGTNAHAWWVDDVEVTGTYDGIGEEGNENVALSVMPNPANDVIRVNGLNDTEEVSIINTLGQVVKSERLSDGQSINISDLSAGVYMLRSQNSAQVVKFTVK